MLALIPDAIAADAPDREHRLGAAERAAAMPVPSASEEVWRYSRIGELELGEFRPAPVRTTVEWPSGLSATGAPAPAHLTTLTVHDLFDELNNAFHQAVTIEVPAGRTFTEPVVVTHTIDAATGADGRSAQFPRLVVVAGADSEFTVTERFVSADDVEALVVPRLILHAGQASRVTYLGLNLLGPKVWMLGHQQAVGERDSTTQLATVALGGDYARMRTDARIAGQGGTTKQIGLYYADGTQMLDFRTLQDHDAPRTNSDLLFKGVVQDHAKSVYTGLIRIREHAKGSVAYQTNRNLTLSEGAWAESVPNLEIETNDVKCSHASAIGPVDEEQRFYLESRGIPPEVAERLIVLGFFDDVLAALPTGSMAGELRERVAAKLQRRVA